MSTSSVAGLGRPEQTAVPDTGPMQQFARNAPYVKPGAHEFNTRLPPEQEAYFREWVAENSVPFQVERRVSDYDMRGFWKAMKEGDPMAKQAAESRHFPDKWKTPYHESFSAESQWARPNAPKWRGDRLVDQFGRTVFDAREHP